MRLPREEREHLRDPRSLSAEVLQLLPCGAQLSLQFLHLALELCLLLGLHLQVLALALLLLEKRCLALGKRAECSCGSLFLPREAFKFLTLVDSLGGGSGFPRGC